MKILSGHQSNYLPYPGLFYKITHSDGFIFVDHVQFERKSWQNRNRIRTVDGWTYLTVPTIKKGKLNQSILEVQVDKTRNWREKHLASLWHNYHNASYYEELASFLEEYYAHDWEYLYQWNRAFTLYVLEKLEIDTPIYYSENYRFEQPKTKLLIEMCRELGFDGYLSNEGSRVYVDESLFAENGLSHSFCNYTTPVYKQQYPGFEANLSIIDMIANTGFAKTRELIFG